MPLVYENTKGTAIIKLKIPRNDEGIFEKPLKGCFVKRDANLDKFVQEHIEPSADSNKYESSDYLFYSPVVDYRQERVTEADIIYEKISKLQQKTKTCTVKNPLIITFNGCLFLCCDRKDLNKNEFLKECSKKVRINQTLDPRKRFYGLGMEDNYLKFISFKMRQPQNYVYEINDSTVFKKLLSAGPLLLDDKKAIVGCYRKTTDGNCRIEIDMFEKSQDGATSLTPLGHSERDGATSLSVIDPNVTLSYNYLMVETTRHLEVYITSGRGTMDELKSLFRGLLPEIERTSVRSVRELVDALDKQGFIGANDVTILKTLAENLELRELKDKVEEFEAHCSERHGATSLPPHGSSERDGATSLPPPGHSERDGATSLPPPGSSERDGATSLSVIELNLRKSGPDHPSLLIKGPIWEIDSLLGTISNVNNCGTRKHCHTIEDTWPMTKSCLFFLHNTIFSLLKATPTLSSPWFCSFTRDVPKQIFDIIWKRIIEHNSFENESQEYAAYVIITITDKRKAIYLFKHMNHGGIVVNNCKLLMRDFRNKAYAEVIVSREKPMCFKYRKSREVLTTSFHYGYWNEHSIPQH